MPSPGHYIRSRMAAEGRSSNRVVSDMDDHSKMKVRGERNQLTPKATPKVLKQLLQ